MDLNIGECGAPVQKFKSGRVQGGRVQGGYRGEGTVQSGRVQGSDEVCDVM